MAVAKPSIFRVRTPTAAEAGGGGYTSGLGQAVGALADVAERRTDKEKRKKIAIETLAAKNRFADRYKAQVADDAFDGLDGAEVRSVLDEWIQEEVAGLRKTDAEAAEALDYELSVQATLHVEAATERERIRNRAVVGATLTKTQERLDTALGEYARAQTGGSSAEQVVAFEAQQMARKDWDRALEEVPEDVRVKAQGWFDERAAHHRRIATVNRMVRQGDADELLGRIANRTDYYSGNEGERITSGLTPDEVTVLESKIRSQATEEDNRREARIDRIHKQKVRDDQVAVAKGIAEWNRLGRPDPERFADAWNAKGRGDLAASFMSEAARYGRSIESAEQTRRKSSPIAETEYQEIVSRISIAEADDFYPLQVQINNAHSDTGVLDDDRGAMLSTLLSARQAAVSHRNTEMRREEADRERTIDRIVAQEERSLAEWRQQRDRRERLAARDEARQEREAERAAVEARRIEREQAVVFAEQQDITEGALAFTATGDLRDEESALRLQQSFTQRVPTLRAFVQETGTDPKLAFSLAGSSIQAVQAHIDAGIVAEPNEFTRAEVTAAEARDRRTLDLLASKGFTRETLTERHWLGIRMDEGLYTILMPYFDADTGALDDYSAHLAVERAYGAAAAAVLWEGNLEAHRRDHRHVLNEVGSMEQAESASTAMKLRADLASGTIEAQLNEAALAQAQTTATAERLALEAELGVAP